MNYHDSYQVYHDQCIDTLKGALYLRHENIFERLSFEDDLVFEEPLLYSYINQSDEKWLDSIIYGYEIVKKKRIIVYSNTDGVVYIPKIGYFLTELKSHEFDLEWNNGNHLLFTEGKRVDFIFEPLLFNDFGFEILKYLHPLFEDLFLQHGGNLNETKRTGLYLSNLNYINIGCEIISTCNSELFSLIQLSVKRIFLFNAYKPNSFATMSAHNMIFLNVNEWDNEVFFVDHITHESSHIIYFTLTLNSKFNLFKCPYNTGFTQLDGSVMNTSIYLFFHGLFTFSEITKTLVGCMRTEYYKGDYFHEINARFVFHMSRFQIMLDEFGRLDIFQAEGYEWFKYFENRFNEYKEIYLRLSEMYNLNSQPYDFNLQLFRDDNADVLSGI